VGFIYLQRQIMRHGSLFSGIGGFDLASEWMGWENVFHCEWNEFGKKVLHHYWPNAESFDDITKTDFTKYANKIDILTGGFPCQPYSNAGQRKGKEDERHLWPEMLRAIQEIKPKYIVGENVFGLLNWNGGMVFDEVHSDLEFEGYEVQAVVIPAAAVNAPHGRDRVWFVATNTNCDGLYKCNGNNEIHTSEKRINAFSNIKSGDVNGIITNSDSSGQQTFNNKKRFMGKESRTKAFGGNSPESVYTKQGWDNFPTQSPICGGDDGLPTELDGITFSKWRAESIKAYGNAIVPQVAYEIFKAIKMTNGN
jgi:DNA (cytosine-5)-methyltransferase 1